MCQVWRFYCKPEHETNSLHVIVHFHFLFITGGWSNTKSVIRDGKQGAEKFSAETPNILSCNESRAFWLSWAGGNIEMGTGDVPGGSVSILSWQDSTPRPVNAISVTSGWGAAATWQLELQPGECSDL